MKYFAYGSNMDQQRMTARGIHFSACQAAQLLGYRLHFNKKNLGSNSDAFANICPSENCITEGVLYEITDAEIARLDKAEGCPTHYYRTELQVHTNEGSLIPAQVYIATADMVDNGLNPARNYLQHLLEAKAFLSPAYYEWLKNTVVAEDIN